MKLEELVKHCDIIYTSNKDNVITVELTEFDAVALSKEIFSDSTEDYDQIMVDVKRFGNALKNNHKDNFFMAYEPSDKKYMIFIKLKV